MRVGFKLFFTALRLRIPRNKMRTNSMVVVQPKTNDNKAIICVEYQTGV